MYQNMIYKRIGKELSKEDGCICVQGKNERYLLNITASLVWEYIDGNIRADAILENITRLYMQNNPISYIEAVFNESIALLLKCELIESVEER